MKVIKKDKILYDVDSTLVFWPKLYRVQADNTVKLEYYDTTVYLTTHDYHIDLLKAYKRRGYHITVHSANGWQWALNVVKALNLEKYVDEVSTKFVKYVDDKPADDWTKQVYIEAKTEEDINA